jgi:hypothetical protein
MTSPYANIPVEQWQHTTRTLIEQHPLPHTQLYQVVLQAWADLFHSHIGSKPFIIGVDLFPSPQIMGFFLHELIPLELAFQSPQSWRVGQPATEKDAVYIPNDQYAFEIKTSSSANAIYGNRSYTQATQTPKKDKSGYYLAINFEKFTPKIKRPQITQVRFGWLDQTDWIGQTAASGQQARLQSDANRYKLLPLPLI